MPNSFIKIWSITAVLALTFASLIYWGLNNYRQSASAIERITQPNSEPAITNSIFKSVIESDLHLNYFILTNDTLQYRLFLERQQETDSLLNLLSVFGIHGRTQQVEIDSLKLILEEKNEVSDALVELKQRQNSQFFTEQALNRIKAQLSDSAFIDKAITQRQALIAKRDTIEKVDLVARPDNFEGIGGFFRKIFGREIVETDTVRSLEEQINYNLEMLVDSSIVRNYFVDTTLVAVKGILLDVLEDEIRLQGELLSTELEVLTYNELLLSKIRDLLESITSSSELTLAEQQKMAIDNIDRAHKQAFIIMALGIALGIILLLILGKDIAKTNLYRRILEQEKERAEALAQAKEIFLSKMSHEIRTPIHSISGFAQLLEAEALEGNKKKLLNGISNANHYLNELIENLLEQSKLNAGTYEVKSSEVYIPEVCNSMKVLFSHREEEHQNTLNISCSENLLESAIITDEIKLKQVLINLLGNAFKFTRNGQITLAISLKGVPSAHYLQLEVSDTGAGIHKSDQESIFEPFRQSKHGPTSVSGGAGLGLAIIKSIVESFGGTISLTSEPSKGTKFLIEYPVRTVPFNPTIKEDVTETNQRFDIRLLAVEDDEWNALLLENYLSNRVSSFTLFDNAEDAFEELSQRPTQFDILVTDLNLPGMSGRDLFTKMRTELGMTIPTIALSASLGKVEIQELKEIGFQDALGKPFTQADVLRTIRQVLNAEASNPKEISEHNQLPSENPLEEHDIIQHLNAFLPEEANDRQKFVERFLTSVIEKCDAFLEAVQAKDAETLKKSAHQLISSLEQVAITKYSEHLHSIEVCVSLQKNDKAFELAIDLTTTMEQLVLQFQNILDKEVKPE